MATIDEVINQMSEEDYTDDSIQFVIDNDLRIISIPDRGVVAGVVGDKNVNRINFQMVRYYHGFDMSKFTTRINYINANGSLNYYSVTDLSVSDDLLYFSWLVDSDVTAYTGNVMFAVCMIKTDSNGTVQQSFNTSDDGQLKVLGGIRVDDSVTSEEQIDILNRLKSDMLKYMIEQEKVAKNEIMSYARNDAIDAFNGLSAETTNSSIAKISKQGTDECEKIEQKGNAMISDLKRKLYFTDTSTDKEYVGEIKIVNGKPVLEYEEVTT